ncbi:hypothetical protein WAI453_011001 [Rhynchosporium graminicola]
MARWRTYWIIAEPRAAAPGIGIFGFSYLVFEKIKAATGGCLVKLALRHVR